MPGKSGKMKNHISGIYCITNKENGKKYIGQSKSCTTRWRSHTYALINNKHTNSHLQATYNSSGLEVFEYFILEECLLEDRDNRERYWIDYYNSTNQEYGYNYQSGGCKNKTLAEETKRKIGNASKGNKYRLGKLHTQDTIDRLRELNIGENNAFYGKIHTEEVKIKNATAHTGIIQSEESNKKRSDIMKKLIEEGKFTQTTHHGNKGKKWSEEARKNMSDKMTGKKQSLDHIEKRAKYHRGKITSEETKIKMSEAAKNRFKNVNSYEVKE